MAARAMWKAELAVGKLKVPVKLYAAAGDSTVHFRLLHEKDHAPVEQRMMRPDTEEPVAPDEVQRGVEVERGVFVIVTDEERAKLEPKPSREIEVDRVVPVESLDLRWFDRPYWLGPDGDKEAYFALAEALESRGQLGIAHWVMRKKRYSGALQARGGHLLLETLRHTEELVQLDEIQPPKNREPDKRELALAEQLVGTLEGPFDPDEYKDEYREQVLALVDAKAKGKVLRFRKPPKQHVTRSLAADLEASLKRGRTRRAGGHRGR